MKFVAWLPQPDGSFIQEKIPGSNNYQALLTGWRVFRVACIMLSLIGKTALSAYHQWIEISHHSGQMSGTWCARRR